MLEILEKRTGKKSTLQRVANLVFVLAVCSVSNDSSDLLLKPSDTELLFTHMKRECPWKFKTDGTRNTRMTR